MNHQDCLGVNKVCSHHDQDIVGKCVCKDGYEQVLENDIACAKRVEPQPKRNLHVTCSTDDDCKRGEVCMSWKYDPAFEVARKLRSRISPEPEIAEKHQLCIDAWIIYKHHIAPLASLDEPRTGGGLRSRTLDAEDYFFEGRRPPRVQQQYIGFAEDMMLILFLVCILATLVTVHRAACYRSIQDARRNSPLRHILPLAEDRPPPYVTDSRDSADGLSDLVNSVMAPKTLAETPPPTYEEALFRQSVRLPADHEHEEQLEAGAAAEVVSSGAINTPQIQIMLQNVDPPANFHIEAENVSGTVVNAVAPDTVTESIRGSQSPLSVENVVATPVANTEEVNDHHEVHGLSNDSQTPLLENSKPENSTYQDASSEDKIIRDNDENNDEELKIKHPNEDENLSLKVSTPDLDQESGKSDHCDSKNLVV